MSQYFLKLGFTMDTSALLSQSIYAVTGGPSHALIEVLEVTPAGRYERYYYESIWKVDPETGKDGVRGPVPIVNLLDWVAEKKADRSLVEVPEAGYLPLSSEEAAEAVRRLNEAVPVIRYARKQLARNLIARTGLRIARGAGSPTQWTCCETPLRTHVLPPRWWAVVGVGDILFDETWPGGDSRYSLMEAARRVVKEYGTVCP